MQQPLSDVVIARISTVPYFVKTQLIGQLRCISCAGATLHVITSYGKESDELEKEGYFSYHLLTIKRRLSIILDLIAIWEIYFFYRRNQVKIAHSTTPKAGLVSSIGGLFARVPVRLHTFTGQAWSNKSGFQYILGWLGDYLISKFSTHCYADSEAQKLFLTNKCIVASRKLTVIGAGSLAGVDTLRFNPLRFSNEEKAGIRAELKISNADSVILFVGRVTQEKGINELLSAFVASRKSVSNLHLIVVGHEDTDSGSIAICGLSSFSGIDNLHIVGHSDEPEKYMSISNFLCLPSFREGFGTVAIEAAAMGVPTIASDIYGLQDSVIHMETGLKVKAGDIGDLTRAILLLTKDDSLCKKLGSQALKHVRNNFDSKTVNKNLIEEYRVRVANYDARHK